MSMKNDIEEAKKNDPEAKRYLEHGKTFVTYLELGEYVPEKITFKKYGAGYQLSVEAYNEK